MFSLADTYTSCLTSLLFRSFSGLCVVPKGEPLGIAGAGFFTARMVFLSFIQQHQSQRRSNSVGRVDEVQGAPKCRGLLSSNQFLVELSSD